MVGAAGIGTLGETLEIPRTAPSRDQLVPRHRDTTRIAGKMIIPFPITHMIPPRWNRMLLEALGLFLVSVTVRGKQRPR